jgi:hypothetical protein
MQRQPFRGFSRRRLLQTLGLGAACGPLLPILNASGQEALRPKRLILLFTPDGCPARDYNSTTSWQPQGSETSFTFGAMHAPLEAFKSKIVVPWGMTLTAGGAGEAHAFGMAGLWTGSTLNEPSAGADFDGGNGNRTGWGSGTSIDQLIAGAYGPESPYQRPTDDPMPETRFRSVALGVQCQNPTSLNRMTYSAPNQPIHPEMNPRNAFDRLLAGVTPPTGSGGASMPDPALVKRHAEQRLLVDVLKQDLERVRGKIGSADMTKIDAHLEGLLALERQIGSDGPAVGPALSCTPGAQPAQNSSFPNQIKEMMDITVAALACDVTRVVSLQLSYAFSHVLHTWLGHTSDHHQMSHDGQDRRTELTEIDVWYAEQVAYLLGKLDAVEEGAGTLLDNTLIAWGRELGSTAHRMDNTPFLFLGGAAGALRGGRYLNVGGQQHVKALVSACQLMGMDVNSLGNRSMNSGGLTGLV